jgi:small subunit ribosomal protein S11
MPQRKTAKKKTKKIVDAFGIAHIKATFNNTIITITNQKGDVLVWNSGGRSGFKGTRKGTPYAAQLAGRNAARDALALGVKQVEVWMKGPGPGREAAIRALQSAGLEVTRVKDVTPVPHDGCRPRKKRRV